MSENDQLKKRDKDPEQSIAEGQDQETSDANLDEVTGGANAHEMKKSLIGNFPR